MFSISGVESGQKKPRIIRNQWFNILAVLRKNEICTAYGNRTRDSSVKGMRLNPLTNAA
jgi:hypothetical protein